MKENYDYRRKPRSVIFKLFYCGSIAGRGIIMEDLQIRRQKSDILIIGGGTAGCYAALTIRQESDASVLIAEKANIKRSGCLAAGVNALNAYITKGMTPDDYVDYAKNDANGIVREDLLLTMSGQLNAVTAHMESLGLVILKDENGEYVTRGNAILKLMGKYKASSG